MALVARQRRARQPAELGELSQVRRPASGHQAMGLDRALEAPDREAILRPRLPGVLDEGLHERFGRRGEPREPQERGEQQEWEH